MKKSFASKQVFTTGEAARVCMVTSRTVIKWCNTGMIKFWQIPGGSHDRRIERADLVAFMEKNAIPMDNLNGAVL